MAYEGNSYSVPWKLIGREVELVVEGGVLLVWDKGKQVAQHTLAPGRSAQRVVDAGHLKDVIRLQRRGEENDDPSAPIGALRPGHSALLRPLEEYDALCAGGDA
ncbi:MAG: hypothetical protein IOD12_02835 [Silvanigrellales bacterium]|nr:hypothetical protein [Silvanigrellales bacterium]